MNQTVAIRSPTLLDLGTGRLTALCRALDFDSVQTRAATGVFRRLAGTWGAGSTDEPPRWPSDVTDDHTPFEFSVAIDGAASEVRFLIEVQGVVPSMDANWEAARSMTFHLAEEFGADIERLSAIESLFEPTARCPRFGMWHAVCVRPGSAPHFKIYLNPQARGKAEAWSVVADAMTRLGFRAALSHLPLADEKTEPCYFSLDLSARAQARIKVYFAHHDATSAQVEEAISQARGYAAGRASDFCTQMAGFDGPFTRRPVLTCQSFVEGSATPSSATVHFPVRSYVHDDRVVEERVLAYIHRGGASTYGRALKAFARRPLAERGGMQTYVSLRVEGQRLTVYLAPEAYTAASTRECLGLG